MSKVSEKPVSYEVDRDGRPDLSKAQREELKRLAEMRDEDIDYSDIPPLADWSTAERGKFYRPVKQQITLRLDADLVHWFKTQAKGGGYQTRINLALRRFVEQEMGKAG